MDIKINDQPVTIKTITIDEKKLTKQLLQQIPLGHFLYRKAGDKLLKVGYMLDKYDYSINNLALKGTLIGWVNLHIDKEAFINKWMGKDGFTYKNEITETYLVIFINNEGELRRSYVDMYLFKKLFANDYPQLYI